MKKIEIIDALLPIFNDETYQHHPEVISRLIAFGFNSVFFSRLLPNMRLDRYVKKFVRTVEYDEAQALYFITPPDGLSSVPDYPDGIYSITPMKDQKNANITFLPVSSIAASHFRRLEVSKVTSSIYYTYINNRIEFQRFDTDFKGKDILIYGIPSFEALEDEDDVPIPKGMGPQLVAMIRDAIKGAPHPKESIDQAKTV